MGVDLTSVDVDPNSEEKLPLRKKLAFIFSLIFFLGGLAMIISGGVCGMNSNICVISEVNGLTIFIVGLLTFVGSISTCVFVCKSLR